VAFVLSPRYRSNPGTPTQVRRPDFIYVANQQQQQQAGLNYYDFPIHQQQTNQMMIHPQSQSGLPPYTNGSPQRRFLSEGELLSRNGLSNELSYVNRTNNTVDNIRELAGSPQRGVYNWKDNSPPGYNNPNQMPMGAAAMYSVAPGQQQQQVNSSNNFIGRPPLPTTQQQQQQQYLQNQNMVVVTSAQQQLQQQQQIPRQSNVSNIINNIVANSANASSYHPALRGGVQVFPPQVPASPQVKRKQTPTRPISFVRALEMANSIEMTNTNYQQQGQQQVDQIDVNKAGSEMNPSVQQTQQIADRGSIYDTNYEISV
jgi:palmitoyltransferase ZDHHC5/8